MKYEILLAILSNIKGLGCAGLFVSVITLFFGLPITDIGSCNYESKERTEAWARYRRTAKIIALSLILPSLLITILPTIDDLWKVRISLIKFEMASPENIKGGVETIERIGHKLECKYLGCESGSKPGVKND
jgi:hypothetical protein